MNTKYTKHRKIGRVKRKSIKKMKSRKFAPVCKKRELYFRQQKKVYRRKALTKAKEVE